MPVKASKPKKNQKKDDKPRRKSDQTGSSSAPGRSGGSGNSSKSGSSAHTSISLGDDNKGGAFKRIACIRYVRPMGQSSWGFPSSMQQPYCGSYGYQPYYDCYGSCPPPYGCGYYAGEFPQRNLLIIPPKNEQQYRKAKKSDLEKTKGRNRKNDSGSESSDGDDDDRDNEKAYNKNKTKYYQDMLCRMYPTVDWKHRINVTTSIIKVRDPTCEPRQCKVITTPCYDPCCKLPINPYRNGCCNPCAIANRMNAKLMPKKNMESDAKSSSSGS